MNSIKYVSGPILIVKLEGSVNNKKKNIVLFGELHYDKINRNNCEELVDKEDRIFITDYLNEIITKSNKTIDFFLETDNIFKYKESPKILKEAFNNKDQPILYNLETLFLKYSGPWAKKIKNKRFHWTDKRNDFENILTLIEDDTVDKSKIFYFTSKHSLKFIKIILNLMLEALNSKSKKDFYSKQNKYTDIFININPKINKIDLKLNLRRIFKIISKIFFRYNNANIQKKIREIAKKIIVMFQNNINSNNDISGLNVFTIIIDLYILRRILDKSYISNIINYTGAFHTRIIMFILVKYFNFKITYQYQTNVTTTLKNDSFENIYNSYFSNKLKEIPQQCVEISGLPKYLF